MCNCVRRLRRRAAEEDRRAPATGLSEAVHSLCPAVSEPLVDLDLPDGLGARAQGRAGEGGAWIAPPRGPGRRPRRRRGAPREVRIRTENDYSRDGCRPPATPSATGPSWPSSTRSRPAGDLPSLRARRARRARPAWPGRLPAGQASRATAAGRRVSTLGPTALELAAGPAGLGGRAARRHCGAREPGASLPGAPWARVASDSGAGANGAPEQCATSSISPTAPVPDPHRLRLPDPQAGRERQIAADSHDTPTIAARSDGSGTAG